MTTNADRQRAYRQRHLAEGGALRLNTVVAVTTKRQLERLARHRGVSQRALLEALLADAEREAVAGIAGDELTAYYR